MPNNIPCGNCMLIAVTQSNVWFIEELFRHDDVKKYYVLRDDHAANIRSFCQYIVNSNIQNASLNYIIFNDYGDEVGFISAEPVVNRATGMPMWNVGYLLVSCLALNTKKSNIICLKTVSIVPLALTTA